MPEDRPSERRLAAVVNGDVVGFSRLMATDEDATVRAIEATRERISAAARRQQGRLVDFTGDNFLAEFPAAANALRFAFRVHALGRSGSRRADASDLGLRFRLGIHLGEVRVGRRRLYGDTVNVAARLQSLATAGGVCASEAVRNAAGDAPDLLWEDLGHRPVRNIPTPVHVYRVHAGRREADAKPLAARPEPAPLAALSGRPAIAVLAFENMSRDPDQEFFADGIAEDLLTRLAAQGEFPVISRNSSFKYKGRSIDLREVGRDLCARYVVEGSLRRAGPRVRITAQLIDAETGHHVWAEYYDRELHDVFAVQDEITASILRTMQPELLRHETDRVLRAAPASLGAWECVLRGFWYANRSSLAHDVEARTFFAQALALDPTLYRAHCGMVMTHYMDALFLRSTEAPWHAQEAAAHARLAAQIAPDDPEVHVALGNAARLEGRIDAAVAEFERAAQRSPNLVTAHSNLGSILAAQGHADRAIAHLESALRLSPQDPWAWAFRLDTGTAHIAVGRYAEAIPVIEQSLAERADWANAWGLLAAARALTGELDAARDAVDQLRRLAPGLTLGIVRLTVASAAAPLVEAVVSGLQRAGLE